MALALGYDEAGQGPVLLLVHGFPMDRRIWSAQVSSLSKIRRVIAVDLRGRGKSPVAAPDGWTMDTYADDLAATLDSLGVESADLAGLSMGGYILFAMWRRHPAKCKSLTFMSTRCEEDTEEAKKGRRRVAALVREKGSGELVPMMFPKVFSPDVSDSVKDQVRPLFEELPPETAAADSLAMRSRPDSTADLASITVPTLVVHGQQDQLVPLQTARKMAKRVPRAEFAAIPGAGHFTPVENPEAVNKAMRDFLAQ